MSRAYVRGWLAFLVLTLAASYFLVVPIFRPHGIYFGWRYRLPDLVFGALSLTTAICVLIVQCTPAARRRVRALKITAAYVVVLVTVLSLDLAFVFIGTTLLGVNHTDVWLYDKGIQSRDNIRDDELGFMRKPNLDWSGPPMPGLPPVRYQTDENGFRNPVGIKQAGVAIVGDSFIEAGALREEETAVQRVEQMSGLETVNLGRTHYGPPQYDILTRRYALKYHPRAVVWAVAEANDLTDSEAFVRWQHDPGSRQSLLQRYASRSIIPRLLPRTAVNEIAQRDLRLTDGTIGKIDMDFSYIPDAPARWAAGWKETARFLREGYARTRAQGVEFLVLFVPIKSRVLGSYVQFRDSRDRDQWLPGGLMDAPGDFGNAVAQECRKIGCDFVDLTPRLREAAARDNRRVYFNTIDVHFDVDGNQVVADEVLNWLRAKGVVTRPAVSSSQN